jgi:ATP-binding cassette subfamily B protein
MRKTHVRQLDRSDCAAACLATVSASYGRTVSITELRDALGTGIRGTTLRGLLRGAASLGYEAQPVHLATRDLLSSYTVPAIAQVSSDGGESHFVVIHKAKRRALVVSDPAKQKVERTGIDQFGERFSGVLVLLAPTSEFTRDAGRKPSTFGQFLKLLSPQKGLFAWAVVSSLVLTILGIAGSMVTKVLFDDVLPHGLESLLFPVFLLFSVVFLIQHLVHFVRQWIILHLSQRIDLPLILGYFRHVYDLPISFFAARPVGDILTRFGDAMKIKDVLTGTALTVVMDVVMAVVTGVVLFSLDRGLFIVIAVFVIISVALILLFAWPYRTVNQRQVEQASVLNSRIIEGLKGVEGIKLEANEDREMEGLEREYVRSLRIGFREGMLANTQSTLISLFQAFVSLVLIVLGVSRILAGDMTIGTLMAFVVLTGFFVDPVIRLISLQLEWQEANLSLRRVSEILQYPTEERPSDEDVATGADAGRIEFDEVTFSYTMRDTALKDVSFRIEPGERVAFVGPSGSGKSTIAKLLLKVHEPQTGSVRVGDANMRELSPKHVRSSISYVPQSVHLYSHSVADNVRMSRPDASNSAVSEALRKAQADPFVSRLPQRMNTMLEEAGAGLSGGERKRIGIARAMLKEADLYVFDEVTSDLDPLSEFEVMRGIHDHLRRSTAIFIAHRLTTVARCDRIFVMDGGRIVEQGTHDELLASGALYASMWAGQQMLPDSTADVDHADDAEVGGYATAAPAPDSPMRYVD